MQIMNRTCKTLPGTFTRSTMPRRQGIISQVPATRGAKTLPRSVCIIGSDNGMGLSRDREILTKVFRETGWRVAHAVHRHCSITEQFALSVHLETPNAQLMALSARNVIIPNAEWWQPACTAVLSDPSVVIWTKTADAERIFRGLDVRVEHMGFCSVDNLSLDMQRSPRRGRNFLHIAGASPNKGTIALIATWQKDWPWLYVVSARPLRIVPPGNVRIIYKKLSASDVQRLQNECLFHIYPSEYEGFGHAQWEGLSCGSVVFATDAPPFDEHGEAFRLLGAEPVDADPSHADTGLARRHKVTTEAIVNALTWAKSLSDEQVADLGARSRKAWEANERAFKRRVRELITSLDESPRVQSTTKVQPFTYVGRVNCVTGQGAAARHQLHILRKHGLRFRVVDAGSCSSPDPAGVDPFVQAARRSDPGCEATAGTIIHLQPNTAESFHRGSFPRPHILVSVWETTKLPAQWVPLISSYDQVWCATEWQREVYRASGVREEILRVVPFSLDPEPYKAQPARHTGVMTFGSVFQWSERKDPTGLIAAYVQAFTAADPVQLLLKSYEGDSPTTPIAKRIESIVKQLKPNGDHPKIGVISSSLDGAGMAAFYGMIDCYVSAHRGEGFGLPIAEALLHGRPVIATGWSAPAEYAVGLFRSVKHAMQAPHGMDWQPFYTPDQQWAQVDRDDLAAAMREAAAGSIACDYEKVRKRFGALAEQAGKAAQSALRELIQ